MKPYQVKIELVVEVEAPNKDEAERLVEDDLVDLKYEELPLTLMDFETVVVEAEEIRDDNIPPSQLELFEDEGGN